MIAKAIAKHLAATVDGLTYSETASGANVFVQDTPDGPGTPHSCVTVMAGSGAAQLTRDPTDLPTIQILTRGEPGDPLGGHDLAAAICSQLTCLDGVALDVDGTDEVFVIGCTAIQSTPGSIGADAAGRQEWSQNYQLYTHAPTIHRL